MVHRTRSKSLSISIVGVLVEALNHISPRLLCICLCPYPLPLPGAPSYCLITTRLQFALALTAPIA